MTSAKPCQNIGEQGGYQQWQQRADSDQKKPSITKQTTLQRACAQDESLTPPPQAPYAMHESSWLRLTEARHLGVPEKRNRVQIPQSAAPPCNKMRPPLGGRTRHLCPQGDQRGRINQGEKAASRSIKKHLQKYETIKTRYLRREIRKPSPLRQDETKPSQGLFRCLRQKIEAYLSPRQVLQHAHPLIRVEPVHDLSRVLRNRRKCHCGGCWSSSQRG